MAWHGEKIGISDVLYSATGLRWSAPYGYWNPVDPDAYSYTISAGNDFYLYFDGAYYLGPSDTLGACNWVLDVTSGTAELEFSHSFDPGWSYAGGYAWSGTETKTITGPGRVWSALPMSHRNYDDLYGNTGSPLFRVRVVSGSIAVNTIYLQIEPPGGLEVSIGAHWSDWVTPPPIGVPGTQLKVAQVRSIALQTWDVLEPAGSGHWPDSIKEDAVQNIWDTEAADALAGAADSGAANLTDTFVTGGTVGSYSNGSSLWSGGWVVAAGNTFAQIDGTPLDTSGGRWDYRYQLSIDTVYVFQAFSKPANVLTYRVSPIAPSGISSQNYGYNPDEGIAYRFADGDKPRLFTVSEYHQAGSNRAIRRRTAGRKRIQIRR